LPHRMGPIIRRYYIYVNIFVPNEGRSSNCGRVAAKIQLANLLNTEVTGPIFANMHRQPGEIKPCGFRDMLADRQADTLIAILFRRPQRTLQSKACSLRTTSGLQTDLHGKLEAGEAWETWPLRGGLFTSGSRSAHACCLHRFRSLR